MSEIQSVNVFSVDEERLKYRVIVSAGVIAAGVHKGEFEAFIPPPTAFANSHRYNQCLVKVDAFTATPTDTIADATWTDGGTAANPPALVKTAGLIIRANIGSSQPQSIKIDDAASVASGGDNQVGGFRQFLPLQIVNVGTTGNGAGAAGPVATAEGFSWVGIGSGISATDPILSANPFGQKVKFTLINPTTGLKNWLVSANGAGGGANGNNVGQYNLQLTITMIPNDRSEGTD
jgi:hypothetical protein